MKKIGKKVYIFGAGASVESGVILVKDVLCEVLNDIEIQYSENEANFGTMPREEFEEKYKKTFELIDETYDTNALGLYQKEVQEGMEIGNDDIKNFTLFRFEAFLTRINECIENGKYLKNYSPELLKELRPYIHYVIFCTLQRSQAKNQEASRNAFYKKFVENFLPKEKDCILISFNYDTLIDEAILNNKSISWSYGVNFDYIDDGFNLNAKAPILLLKPHGSFNWAYCGSCRKFFLYHDISYCNCCELNKEKCPLCHQFARTTILMPPAKKINENNNLLLLQDLKQKIPEVLRVSEEITIIGYSLPEEDQDIQSFIQGTVNNPKVTIVNTSEDDIKKFERLFDKRCRSFCGLNKSFGEFVGT